MNLKALKISDNHGPQKGQNTQRETGYAISPSLMHRNNHLTNCDNECVSNKSYFFDLLASSIIL
jgi:hypothetical protein